MVNWISSTRGAGCQPHSTCSAPRPRSGKTHGKTPTTSTTSTMQKKKTQKNMYFKNKTTKKRRNNTNAGDTFFGCGKLENSTTTAKITLPILSLVSSLNNLFRLECMAIIFGAHILACYCISCFLLLFSWLDLTLFYNFAIRVSSFIAKVVGARLWH